MGPMQPLVLILNHGLVPIKSTVDAVKEDEVKVKDEVKVTETEVKVTASSEFAAGIKLSLTMVHPSLPPTQHLTPSSLANALCATNMVT